MNLAEEAAKREARKNRFKSEEKEWRKKAKQPIKNRVAHTGGNITSNKEEAIAKFLKRKQEEGAPVDTSTLSHLMDRMGIQDVENNTCTPEPPSSAVSRPNSSKPAGGALRDVTKAPENNSERKQKNDRCQTARGPDVVKPSTVVSLAAAEPADGTWKQEPMTAAAKKNAQRSAKRAAKRAAKEAQGC
mmetsp:Transcript_5739/g.6582  ORF Transcript_5739/g.6582 Transcript_5739/m.6582 type:complete len:188 (-) Transcript_5739:204-767(-)